MDPHRVVHELFTSVGLDISPATVRAYWNHHRNVIKEPWACNSPASPDHIPMALYGDAAKILDDGTKIVGIFASLPAVWRPCSSRCARWCLFAVEEHKLYGPHTLNAVFRRIVFSCNLLFHGTDPDQPGLVLAQGRKFVVTELKGDWLRHKQIWRFFSSWTRVAEVCFRCSAKGRSRNPAELFYCLDEHPAWEEYDVAGFLARQLVEPHPCRLARIMFS